jgi:hypothetical protein
MDTVSLAVLAVVSRQLPLDTVDSGANYWLLFFCNWNFFLQLNHYHFYQKELINTDEAKNIFPIWIITKWCIEFCNYIIIKSN